MEFLIIARERKGQALQKLTGELNMLDRDISRVQQRIDAESYFPTSSSEQSAIHSARSKDETEVPVIDADSQAPSAKRLLTNDGLSAVMNATLSGQSRLYDSNVILEHYSDLQSSYFESNTDDPLEAFGEKISRLSKITQLKQVSVMKLGDIAGTSNIISSIELDRDGRLFATAGVGKRIRFYEVRDAINESLELHWPIREIICKSKISSVAWNPYIQQQIAASDYEGLVTIYDSSTGAIICMLEEHEKRCWSVDYSTVDPTKLASGSDDCYVKLWSTKVKKSICTIDGKANICSVRFHPDNGNLLAFGSADHNIHLYDLRYTNRPLDILKGHKKAVSYVRFMNDGRLLSASTDSTLKLWSLAGQDPTSMMPRAMSSVVHTYNGHVNEKNFVGLSVQGDVFACGSENNSVYAYHRDLSKPMCSFKFPSVCPLTDSSIENETQQFVSSVCWRRDSNQLLVANSQGYIRILSLQ